MRPKAKWHPTHEIICNPGGSFLVMLHDGKFYTEGIWDDGQDAEWILDQEGRPQYVHDSWRPYEECKRIIVRDVQPRPQFEAAVEAPDELVDCLSNLATRFRRACEQCGHHPVYPRIARFPEGCCDVACDLMALYMYEHTQFTQVRCVCGEFEHDGHKWLEYGDIIIDITGDQFGESVPSVLVGRSSNWHAAWKADRREPVGGQDEWMKRLKAHYRDLYDRVVALMRDEDG